MQGKTKLPKVEKEFRNASRAVLKKRELEDEFEALLSLSDDEKDTEYGQAILEVADLRMDLAADIKRIIDRSASTSSKAERAELRSAQKDLMDEFIALPDLGGTFEDLQELGDQGGVKRSVGRPPVPFEVNLLRAREDAEASLKKYHDVSVKEGSPVSLEDKSLRHPLPLGKMLELYQAVTRNMGKEGRDELGVLDTEIRKLDAKIDHIISGDEEREREEKLKHAKYSRKGTRLGRPFEPIDELLAKYEAEKSALEARRDDLESTLTPIEKMDRRIKLHEDKIRDLRRVIRAEGWDPKRDDRDSMPFGKDLERVEIELKKLKELRLKAERGLEVATDKRAEREIKRRLVMQEELMRQHERDNQSGRRDSRESINEGLDQLEKEIGSF